MSEEQDNRAINEPTPMSAGIYAQTAEGDPPPAAEGDPPPVDENPDAVGYALPDGDPPPNVADSNLTSEGDPPPN
jgi:hypothetical protein